MKTSIRDIKSVIDNMQRKRNKSESFIEIHSFLFEVVGVNAYSPPTFPLCTRFYLAPVVSLIGTLVLCSSILCYKKKTLLCYCPLCIDMSWINDTENNIFTKVQNNYLIKTQLTSLILVKWLTIQNHCSWR